MRDFLSNQLRTLFKNDLKIIFGKIMETPGLIICSYDEIGDVFVQNSYASAIRLLRKNYNYIFEGPVGSTENLPIVTWSKKVGQSEVLKHGT